MQFSVSAPSPASPNGAAGQLGIVPRSQSLRGEAQIRFYNSLRSEVQVHIYRDILPSSHLSYGDMAVQVRKPLAPKNSEALGTTECLGKSVVS